jgi:hypothetical protein
MHDKRKGALLRGECKQDSEDRRNSNLQVDGYQTLSALLRAVYRNLARNELLLQRIEIEGLTIMVTWDALRSTVSDPK